MFYKSAQELFSHLDKAPKTRSIYSDTVLDELWPMKTASAAVTLNFQLYKFKLMTDVPFLAQLVAAILLLDVC